MRKFHIPTALIDLIIDDYYCPRKNDFSQSQALPSNPTFTSPLCAGLPAFVGALLNSNLGAFVVTFTAPTPRSVVLVPLNAAGIDGDLAFSSKQPQPPHVPTERKTTPSTLFSPHHLPPGDWALYSFRLRLPCREHSAPCRADRRPCSPGRRFCPASAAASSINGLPLLLQPILGKTGLNAIPDKNQQIA
jgi:hypothetical protein